MSRAKVLRDQLQGQEVNRRSAQRKHWCPACGEESSNRISEGTNCERCQEVMSCSPLCLNNGVSSSCACCSIAAPEFGERSLLLGACCRRSGSLCRGTCNTLDPSIVHLHQKPQTPSIRHPHPFPAPLPLALPPNCAYPHLLPPPCRLNLLRARALTGETKQHI
jgi:hypothetical protein